MTTLIDELKRTLAELKSLRSQGRTEEATSVLKRRYIPLRAQYLWLYPEKGMELGEAERL